MPFTWLERYKPSSSSLCHACDATKAKHGPDDVCPTAGFYEETLRLLEQGQPAPGAQIVRLAKWRYRITEGDAWCEFTTLGGRGLTSFGGQVWPFRWPALFTLEGPDKYLTARTGYALTDEGMARVTAADAAAERVKA